MKKIKFLTCIFTCILTSMLVFSGCLMDLLLDDEDYDSDDYAEYSDEYDDYEDDDFWDDIFEWDEDDEYSDDYNSDDIYEETHSTTMPHNTENSIVPLPPAVTTSVPATKVSITENIVTTTSASTVSSEKITEIFTEETTVTPEIATAETTVQTTEATTVTTVETTEATTTTPTTVTTTAPVTEADSYDGGVFYMDMGREAFDISNKERERYGLHPLEWDERMVDPTRLRAYETSIYWSHTRPNGERCFTATDLMFAENIAKGQRSASQVVNSWMNSQGHRENILNPDHNSGCIVCYKKNGTIYWVSIFGY